MKRIVVIADMHCGHLAGLTPPEWQKTAYQKKFWGWYAKEAKKLKGVDVLIVNGDAIDGNAPKSGGSELITTDRLIQAQMAAEAIKQFNPKKVYMLYGTAYHVGQQEDFEEVVVKDLSLSGISVNIRDILHANIGGLVFNIRHKADSRSRIPHTRKGPTLDMLWDSLEAQMTGGEKSDIVIRSHNHYYALTETALGFAVSTPCLQLNSKYGARSCSGHIDIGFLSFEVKNKDSWSMHKHFMAMPPKEIEKL